MSGKKKPISIGLIVLITTMFLFISIDWFYGAMYADTVRGVFLLYIILSVTVIAYTGMKFPTMKESPTTLLMFAALFFGTLIVALPISYVLRAAGSMETIASFFAFGFLAAFVKAYIEEGVFRAILPTFLGWPIACILFGGFHFAMLMTNASVMVAAGKMAAVAVPWYIGINVALLSSLGVFWYFTYKKYGMMGSTGSHFAWNLVAYGTIPAAALIGGALA